MKKNSKNDYLEAAFINWEDAVTSNTKDDTYFDNAMGPYSEIVSELYNANWCDSYDGDLNFVDKAQLAAQLGCELAGLC